MEVRWDSLILMCVRYLELASFYRDWIEAKAKSTEADRRWKTKTQREASQLLLTRNELQAITYLVEVLRPFCACTKELSSNTSCNIHHVFELYNDLFEHIEGAIERLSRKRAGWKKQLIPALRSAESKLRQYYGKTRDSHGKLAAAAIVMDPVQKLTTFESSIWDDERDENGQKYYQRVYHNVVRKLWDVYFKPAEQPQAEPTTSSQRGPQTFASRVLFKIQNRNNVKSRPEDVDELERYLRARMYSDSYSNTLSEP